MKFGERPWSLVSGIIIVFAAGLLFTVAVWLLFAASYISFLPLLCTVWGLGVVVVTARALSEEVRMMTRWLHLLVKVAFCVVSFCVLLFYTQQAFGTYLADASAAWGTYSAQGGILFLWGKQAPQIVLAWLLVSLVTAWTCWGTIAKPLLRPGTKAGRLPKLVFAILALFILARVVLPKWAATWPARRNAVDKALSKSPLPYSRHAEETSLFSPSRASVAVVTAPRASQPRLNPNDPCPRMKNEVLDYRNKGQRPITLVNYPEIDRSDENCFGATLKLPQSWTSGGWCYKPFIPKNGVADPRWEVSLLFENQWGGAFIPVANKGPYHWTLAEDPNLPPLPMNIRLKGVHPGGEGIVFYPQASGACEKPPN